MGKLPGYTGSIDLISGIRQKNNGSFALVEANAIQTRDDGTRLDTELESIKSSILNIAIPTASDATPKAAGTASAGTGTNWSRDDHVHPIQTSVSGNAGTATKLANSRTLNISGVTAEGASFDGSDDATIKITQIPVAIISGLAGVATSGKYSDLSGTPSLATVATSGKYSDLSGTPSIPNASDATPKAAGTAAAGSGTTWARSDHVHPVQTSVSGNAGTATKLATARNIVLSGAISSSAEFDGSDDIELAVTSVDGSKITGVIPLSSIPKGAQERFVPVADDAARLALTTEDVQNGDVVKVEDSGIMYYIADDAKLGTEGAFAVFTAGAASSVAWSGITGKPTFATVATSGKYTDLSDTPDFAAVATSGAYSDLSGTPSLATVATSGKYSDLSGTPSIPSASNATPKVAGTATAGSGTTWARADHVHPAQTSVSGNAGTATKLATARNIVLSGAISSSAEFDGSNDVNLTITSVDGSKITGVIPLSSIPKGAQERFVPVANDTARLALTSSDAQNGDVVKVESDGIMYYIVDDTKLGTEDAFAVFTAGAASSVAWSGITGKPTFAAVATSGSYSDLVDTPNFATVATSGKYTDLTDTPNFATVATSGKYSDLSGTPVLASVATSGKYSDLSGIPSIPNASDATPKVAGTATPGSGTTWSRADHVHPAQTSVSGNAGTATKLATARVIKLSGAISSSAEFDGSNDIELAITSIDAAKITGIIPLSSIPKGAQERFVPVADDAARLALTSDDIQNGDVVKVESDGIMYYIVDDTKLGSEDAFAVFTAGAASSVAWSGITGKPTFAAVATSGSYSDLSGVPTLATVATSGKYSDLSGTPALVDVATSGKYSDLSGTPVLASVATSGKYSDLSGTPSIPNASDATPKVAGTAAAGSETTWSRADHVHPAQTNITGNAGSATKAVKDNKDQQIDATYIKSISVSGKIITITKGDNTTSTITTQDTVSNAFGKVVINGTTISADAATDSLNIEAGDNINITPDATNDKVTISADNPSTTYNATIGTEWAGNEAPYTQTITITGITVNDTPIVDIITNNSDYEALTTQLEEFGSIYRITTAANSITVYTTKKTTVEIPIQLKCVK